MTEKSNTNLYWYIIALFVIVIFVIAMQQFATAMLYNPEINQTLTNDSRAHIFRIKGINVSEFDNPAASQVEKDEAFGETNDTGSQPKDYALEFFYSRSKASEIGVIAKSIFSLPEFILTLLNIPETSISWFISILNWFWRIMIVIATYYFIRGIK